MTDLTFSPTSSDQRYLIKAKLGLTPDSPGRFTSKDLCKLVKMVGAGRYSLADDGDEFEGAVVVVEDHTAEGFGFGSVQIEGRLKVKLAGPVDVGQLVVAASPVAVGTEVSDLVAEVKAGNPVRFKWRLIEGTGTTGSLGIIERV